MPDLSIIIVNFNTRDLLINCLASVYADLHDINGEVWVVDNGSSDGSIEFIGAHYPQVRLIENTLNMGFAYANNQALHLASGQICLLLNSDTVVQKGAIQALREIFETQPDLGAVGLKLLNADYSIQPSFGKYYSAWIEFLFQTFLFKIVPVSYPLGRYIHPAQLEEYSKSHPVDWLTGACLAINKDVLNDAGYLDESTFMYGEDMEWCWRIHQAGYAVMFSPAGSVVHLLQQSSNRDYSAWISRYTSGQLQFIKQHGSWIDLRLSGLFIVSGSIIRVIASGIVGILKPTRRKEAAQRISGYRQALSLGYQTFIGRKD